MKRMLETQTHFERKKKFMCINKELIGRGSLSVENIPHGHFYWEKKMSCKFFNSNNNNNGPSKTETEIPCIVLSYLSC